MFVIANSLTVNKKAVSADWQYNMRVTECRLATVALGARMRHPAGAPPATHSGGKQAAGLAVLDAAPPAGLQSHGKA